MGDLDSITVHWYPAPAGFLIETKVNYGIRNWQSHLSIPKLRSKIPNRFLQPHLLVHNPFSAWTHEVLPSFAWTFLQIIGLYQLNRDRASFLNRDQPGPWYQRAAINGLKEFSNNHKKYKDHLLPLDLSWVASKFKVTNKSNQSSISKQFLTEQTIHTSHPHKACPRSSIQRPIYRLEMNLSILSLLTLFFGTTIAAPIVIPRVPGDCHSRKLYCHKRAGAYTHDLYIPNVGIRYDV